MSRFNEGGEESGIATRRPAGRSAVTRDLALALGTVATSVALVVTLGLMLTRAAGPGLMRYAGPAMTEVLFIAGPAVWLARACGHHRVWLFRLRMPVASTLAPAALIAMSGFVLAGSLEEWTQRLFGPLPATDWELYAPDSGLELAAALL